MPPPPAGLGHAGTCIFPPHPRPEHRPSRGSLLRHSAHWRGSQEKQEETGKRPPGGVGAGHGPAWTPGPQGHSKMTTVRAWLTQGQGLQGCVSARSKEPRRTFWARASRRLGEADADLRLPHGSACVTSSSQPGGHRPPSSAGSEEPGTLRQVGACGAGLLDPHRASCRTPNEAVWVPTPSLMSRKQAKGQRQAREREGRRPSWPGRGEPTRTSPGSRRTEPLLKKSPGSPAPLHRTPGLQPHSHRPGPTQRL